MPPGTGRPWPLPQRGHHAASTGRSGAARTVPPMTTPRDLWPHWDSGLLLMPAGTDVWDLHDSGLWILIPTNTCTKSDGTAVMGAGLALAAATRHPDLPKRYGRALSAGARNVAIAEHRLLLGPTKDDWRRPSTMALVRALLADVRAWCDANPHEALAVAAPGCGRGGLPWEKVRAEATTALAARRVALLPPMPAPTR